MSLLKSIETSGKRIEEPTCSASLKSSHRTLPTQVKAAGGVRDLETLLKVRGMGVSRVGASATAAILDPAREQLGLDRIQCQSNADNKGY